MEITCYRNMRNRDYFDFFLPKGFIFGFYGSVAYATNGNDEGGHMLVYLRAGNAWRAYNVRIRHNPIARTVWGKYGVRIVAKNAAYAGSAQEQADIRREAEREYGRHLDVRVSKPYDRSQPFAKEFVHRAVIRERRQV